MCHRWCHATVTAPLDQLWQGTASISYDVAGFGRILHVLKSFFVFLFITNTNVKTHAKFTKTHTNNNGGAALLACVLEHVLARKQSLLSSQATPLKDGTLPFADRRAQAPLRKEPGQR